MTETVMPGPCVVCGLSNYPLSMGGPTICPSCDCGDFGPTKIERQRKEIERLASLADDMGQTNIANQIKIERLQRENDALRKSIHQGGMNTAPLAEIERLKAMTAHAAGFLDGMAARIEGWRRWDSGEGDSESFTQAAQDCRTMAASLHRKWEQP